MTEYKNQINKHLKDYGKLEAIDSNLVEQAAFILGQIELTRHQILEHGTIHITKNGYSSKNGYLQAYEALMKSYGAISDKLGLSPKDREKWVKPMNKKRHPLIN